MFFNNHTDDITAFAYWRGINPFKKKGGVEIELIATGEIGPKPLIHIWDPTKLEPIRTWKGQLLKGVTCLAFSPNGKRLAGCGLDNNHMVAVFDVRKKSKKALYK